MSLSPHTAPALIAIMTYYLFSGIASGGAQSGGGETTMSVHLGIEHFY